MCKMDFGKVFWNGLYLEGEKNQVLECIQMEDFDGLLNKYLGEPGHIHLEG